MKRGDIVIVADRSAGDFAGKPRPAVVIQDNAFEHHASVTVCLITGRVRGWEMFRVPIGSDDITGLREPSEVSVDKIQTIRADRVGAHIGRAPGEVMFSVDQALRRWLAL